MQALWQNNGNASIAGLNDSNYINDQFLRTMALVDGSPMENTLELPSQQVYDDDIYWPRARKHVVAGRQAVSGRHSEAIRV